LLPKHINKINIVISCKKICGLIYIKSGMDEKDTDIKSLNM